ncbi:Protein of unknown function [Pyronema omphalodes CBS 100304]|uniref:Uncharacterized protein n=1 Tax=Pyronema omphalodes (strain CBS 100304) TaxID=1076935 RepID=U4LW40_PYROM|nr:Protein of unknown function [Pyronema omphalodes CBS 100304]
MALIRDGAHGESIAGICGDARKKIWSIVVSTKDPFWNKKGGWKLSILTWRVFFMIWVDVC